MKLRNTYKKLISNNGKLMFIGTKRAASDIVKKYSDLTSMPYVNNRWLGGLLTNFNTIRKSISKLEDLRTRLKNQKIYNLSKKQIIDLKREIERLEKIYRCSEPDKTSRCYFCHRYKI